MDGGSAYTPTLASFIATHPQGWALMVERSRVGAVQPMVDLLCEIVPELDADEIWLRLRADR